MKLGKLKPFQLSAAKNTLSELSLSRAAMVKGAAGLGKTFVIGEVLNNLLPNLQASPLFPLSRAPILYATAAAVVEPTAYKLETYFGLDKSIVKTISFSSLIANAGETLIERQYPEGYEEFAALSVAEKKAYYQGIDMRPFFKWRSLVGPLAVVVDECHRLKNSTSLIYRLFKDFVRYSNEIAQHSQQIFGKPFYPKVIFASATPFVKVSDGEIFTRLIDFEGLSDLDKSFVQTLAKVTNVDPRELSAVGMSRFMAKIDRYVINIPNIRQTYKNNVGVKYIDFDCIEDKAIYLKAMEDYLKTLASLGKTANFGKKQKLVEARKFQEKAEFLKKRRLAREVHEIRQRNKAAIVGCNFQGTIVGVITELKKLGYDRSEIAVVWGGSDKFTPLKRIYSPDEIIALFSKAFSSPESLTKEEKEDIEEIYKQVNQTSIGMVEELTDAALNLGVQSSAERTSELDAFASGKKQILILSFKAGSVGLDAHHCNDYYVTRPHKYECAKGYSPEDNNWIDKDTNLPVPYKPLPRETVYTPTWDATEWVQFLGRAHRLTSLSDTYQTALAYKGTIEQKVMGIGYNKFRSLAAASKQAEAWMSLLNPDELKTIVETTRDELIKEQVLNAGAIENKLDYEQTDETFETEVTGEE